MHDMENTITLLDGKTWDIDELIQKMYDDSFYYGYLGQSALSSSSAKKLLESPKAYYKSLNEKQEDIQAFRDGRLIHMHLVEREKLADLFVTEGDKKKKEFKDMTEKLGSHVVYSQLEMIRAQTVSSSVLSNPHASFLLDDCYYEKPIIGYVFGLPFRAKADAITIDGRRIIDIKTTSSDIVDFKYAAKKFKYAMQAYIYLQLFGAEEFTFLVVNKFTGDVGIFECSLEFIEYGKQLTIAAVTEYKENFGDNFDEKMVLSYVYRDIL